ELAGQSFPRAACSATGLDLFQRLTALADLGHDCIHGCGPDERLRLSVPVGQEIIDCCGEFLNAEERAAANAFVGQLCEPALNQIQPTATGGHVMNDKAAMPEEPGLDFVMVVRRVVVDHDVQFGRPCKLAVDLPQKANELLVAMALLETANDLALQ